MSSLRSTFSIFLAVVLLAFLSACQGYRHPEFLVRNPSYYDSKAQNGDLVAAADPYLNTGKQNMLFHYNAVKRGVYPVQVLFFNEGDTAYDLSQLDVALVDQNGKRFKPLSQKEVKHLVSRSVMLRAGEFGAVGSLGLFFTVPAAMWGGMDAYKSNTLAGNIFSKNSLKPGQLDGRAIYQGFLFFNPTKGMKRKLIKKRMMEESYQLEILGVKDAKGETINYSLYLAPQIS